MAELIGEAGISDDRPFIGLMAVDRLTAILAVHSREPRNWTADEVALIEATAERTWAAVEQAKTEAALRVSEAQNAAVFAHAAVGLAELDFEGRFLRVNPALCAARSAITWQITTLMSASADCGW